MSKLKILQAATSLHELADLLGFKPKAVSYILFKKDLAAKYTEFEIPKRAGGKRLIQAPYPELMNLQRRLSELLQDCIAEINAARDIDSVLSHGFRRKYSIITNAVVHRSKRFVLNIDLANFFGTINFGRIRGFFISNRNFALQPKVATLIAQIACHDHVLPQGSPCSPVISNLIGHLLDVRLSALAFQTGCTYSRYADDITFSTNKPLFPAKLAKAVEGDEHRWEVGKTLFRAITKAGFEVNAEKTRLQYTDSRQEVTGLVVNSKINTRSEYRRTARAMVHRLVSTGSFYRKRVERDGDGEVVISEKLGTLEQLNGILSFIDSVGVYNKKKGMKDDEREKPLTMPSSPDCQEKDYRKFLFYKHFFAIKQPMIVCEGKTDNIYLSCAIRRLAKSHLLLASPDGKGGSRLQVSFYKRTATTDRTIGLTGGTDQLISLIKEYRAESRRIKIAGKVQPLILLIDNDNGAKGIFAYLKNLLKVQIDPNAPYFEAHEGLYVVPTPLTSDAKGTMIEDFFDESVLKTMLNGKTFNPSNEGVNHKTEYGKAYFASHVIKKHENTIDFSGFKPILDRLEEVIAHHQKKHQ
ncbi:retron Ec67 family RNA-directed DNA polymerase/endonuclease [Paraburkholderia tuberum]|uniref:RNA-directed DNA polymerase n=1 Tax=Paraburkholderia tuberum TaxID=157910 RepID=A0A1H1A9K5_9BURK|nr:retron Ec67 family RNA-directed DNA polymerase/endonuclease [Paraburkholderia tuberum]SDQ36405.1 Reverse transcriptase (RNA-dependent DNA polymerase) [Paraburkholderia tuberum]